MEAATECERGQLRRRRVRSADQSDVARGRNAGPRKNIILDFPPRKINTVYCRMIGNEIETERERELSRDYIASIYRAHKKKMRKERKRERGLGRQQNELS